MSLQLHREHEKMGQLRGKSPDIDSVQSLHESVECRWKPLEASFAAIGSQSEDVLECIENEQDSGRAKPIDVEDLLANVVPSVLNQSGMHQASSCRIRVI
jgi:hypothetical protein